MALDTETTGVDVETDRIVTAVLVRIDPGEKPEVMSWLVDPGVEIPAEATEVHSITTEYAREHGRPPGEVIPEILDALERLWTPERPLVGHNPTFDLTITDREAARHCGRSLALFGPVVDTLTCDRHAWKYVKGAGQRKLVAACARYGIELTNAHDAEADATASARLAWAISRKFPQMVGLVAPATLHERQRQWYRTWAVEFADYLGKQVLVLQRGVKFRLPLVVAKVLGEGVEPTAENIAAKLDELREKAADVRRCADDWPLRPRSAVAESVA